MTQPPGSRILYVQDRNKRTDPEADTPESPSERLRGTSNADLSAPSCCLSERWHSPPASATASLQAAVAVANRSSFAAKRTAKRKKSSHTAEKWSASMSAFLQSNCRAVVFFGNHNVSRPACGGEGCSDCGDRLDQRSGFLSRQCTKVTRLPHSQN